MKAFGRRWLVVVAAVLLVLLTCLWWGRTPGGPSTTKLAVVFVGLTNNPTAAVTPARVELCRGATGLCAVFLVTNITKSKRIWFETSGVERRTDSGWQPLAPDPSSWSGVAGSVWTPEYGCLYAVGWPPGVSTNASWRLQMRYGLEPPDVGLAINQVLGRNVVPRGKVVQAVPSSEVKQ